MWFRDVVPVFRMYLIGLVIGLLMLDTHGNPWIELSVLMLKCAATAEALGVLCSDTGEAELCWLCLFSAGFAGIMCCLTLDYGKQVNLLYADLRTVKHVCQIVLFLVAICMTLFAWVAYESRGWGIKHAGIMCVLWADYAVAGLVAPGSEREWLVIRCCWCLAATVCLSAWHWALATSTEYSPATLPNSPRVEQASDEF